MFARKEKPLPARVLTPNHSNSKPNLSIPQTGILLGSDTYWDPERLPNAHIVLIGASGSGKTQTLKAIAYELARAYSNLRIVVIDFHGDQKLPGETCHRLHMLSPYGVNPLVLNLDPEGGGPNLQAIAVTATLKKTLQLGPNQEGLMLEILRDCYLARLIRQDDLDSWKSEPPSFADVERELDNRAEDGDKEARKLQLKLAATFQYGIFSRPQPSFQEHLIRIDLSKLPPSLQAIAAESLAAQLMNNHRLLGEIAGKLPRTYLFIDEAKELKGSPACDRIIADGRKYGFALVLASQSERHLSADVIGNSASKIVLPVDQTEVKKVSAKFRFKEERVAQLPTLTALCRFGKDPSQVEILPYYERVQDDEALE